MPDDNDRRDDTAPDERAPAAPEPADSPVPAPDPVPNTGPAAPEGGPPADPFAAWREMETRRIDSRNRRIDAMAAAVAANAEVHRRDSELRDRQLQFDREAAERRHRLAMRLFTWGGGFAAAVAALALGFAFVGSEARSAFAKDLLRIVAIALAGGGAFHLVGQAVRWLLRR